MRVVAQRYLRWFEYEQDAHAKVLRSLETVPPERRTSPEFRRAVAILAHIAVARQVWLHRLGAATELPKTIFPDDLDLADVAAQLSAVQARWAGYLARVTDEELTRTFEYQSMDAGRFRNCIEDILTQLFGHSWYHRGQIAMLVRAAGGEPAATDFVYWCRGSVDRTTN
jgi:uncharacterized damage-inducible protein DinB